MPHLIIEYSNNISSKDTFQEITQAAHEAMIQSGLFSPADIKTRSYMAEDFLVGEKGRQGSFVHARIYLLEGRTTREKQNLSEQLRDTLRLHLKNVDQLSVDIRELKKDTYRKSVGE